jgi:large subunit ribosomal protein L54
MSAILRMARGVSTSGAVLTHARYVSGSAVHWAKGAGKGAKKTDAVAADGGASTGSMSTTHCTGLNILKDGKDPELMPDDQYPDWLWTILDPEKGNIAMKTLGELEKELEAAKKADVDLKYDVMAIKDVKRLLRLRRRAKIKANNALRAKR